MWRLCFLWDLGDLYHLVHKILLWDLCCKFTYFLHTRFCHCGYRQQVRRCQFWQLHCPHRILTQSHYCFKLLQRNSIPYPNYIPRCSLYYNLKNGIWLTDHLKPLKQAEEVKDEIKLKWQPFCNFIWCADIDEFGSPKFLSCDHHYL